MSDPLLSVVIPTVGRPSLMATLDSLDAQPEADWLEVLVVADVFGGLTPSLNEARDHVLEERDADRYRWLQHDGGLHCFGQPQRTAGGHAARGPFVWYSQDDNVAAAGAVGAILRATAAQPTPRPIFGRWLSWWRETIWRGPQLALGNIDADCLVLPRAIAREIVWGNRYEGDYDAALEAHRLSGGSVDWLDQVISIARPGAEHEWWKAAAVA